MQCPYCGTQNADNAYRCVHCNEVLREPVHRPVDVTNTLVCAILVALFCCQPLGIVAIVFAALAMSRADAGDRAGALANAEKARTFTSWAFGLGLVWVVFCLLLFLVMAAAG
jgi:hypothetical protein